jgi:hypothetical protein
MLKRIAGGAACRIFDDFRPDPVVEKCSIPQSAEILLPATKT